MLMRRARVLLWLALVSAAGVGAAAKDELLGGVRASVPLGRVEFSGLHHLAREEALSTMEIPADASFFDPVGAWRERLEAHPLVQFAQVSKSFPRSLSVTVEERQAVALVPTPLLEVVDAEGVVLPLRPDELHLDLPLVHSGSLDGTPAAIDVGLLGELVRIGELEPGFLARVSEVMPIDGSSFRARISEPPVTFLVPRGPTSTRVREGLAALTHAIARGAAPASVDLRFAGVVVVRHSTGASK